MTAAVGAASRRFARAEEAFEALKWTIARDPENGAPLGEGGAYARTLEGLPDSGLPTLTALYVLETDRVMIKHVWFE